jgi:two-component system LytT family sensor kinase
LLLKARGGVKQFFQATAAVAMLRARDARKILARGAATEHHSRRSISKPEARRVRSMLKSHWRLWIFVLVGWTLIGLTFTLNYYLFSDHYVAIFRQPPTLREMLVWELPYWFLWAALSPVVFRLTRRFPLERGRIMRNALAHLIACVALSLAHRAIYLLAGWLLHVAVYRQLASLSSVFNFLFFFNLQTGFMSYATILLVAYSIDYYRRHQEEELKISRLEAELAQAQLEMTQAQLQALKSQLQPHFLFNTLNSISTLLDDDTDAADEMLARLGDFLRLTLENSGAQEVSLQEELEFLRCYLEIERVRFQDRLVVRLDIAPDTLDALVPNLILQPLVENAIRHGIVARRGSGLIEINARRDGATLTLRVKDNGPGLQTRDDTAQGSRQGLGFALTRARLERMHGARQRFQLADAPEGGLEVTIELPFITSNAVAPVTVEPSIAASNDRSTAMTAEVSTDDHATAATSSRTSALTGEREEVSA